MKTRKSLLALVLWSTGIIGLLATGCGSEPAPTSLPTAAPTATASPAATPSFTPEPTLMPATAPTPTSSTPSPTSPPTPSTPGNNRLTVVGIESLGVVTFDTGFMFADTEVGGLSGITYDSNREVYYAISDDRSQTNPARYYEVAIDIRDNVLEKGDVTFLALTTLLDQSGSPFASRSLDPEGIALSPEGILYISSEGDADATPPINPFVNKFDLTGKQTGELPVPDKFLPDGGDTFGVRDNLAFESLTVSPDQRFIYTASESALAQDGPVSDVDQESRSRILRYNQNQSMPVEEFGYITGAIPAAPDPLDAFSDNGLVELAALDNAGTLLALERSFAVGVGNTIRLYEVLTPGATDVSGIDDLFDEDPGVPVDYDPVEKRLLVDFADMGLTPDNVEGMTLGPRLSDGRQALILVSDNNFNADQVTQFIVLALDLETSSGGTGSILERGLIDCFEAGLETSEGEPVNCETSAAAYDGTDLILASDKPIPGENRSSVFAIKYDKNGLAIEEAALRYFTPSPLVNAIKYEDLSITPDGQYVIATTGFDRIMADSAEWDNYDTLLTWPIGDPDAVQVVSASTREGITSSVSLRDKLSHALKTAQFPDGPPYFKVEGIAAIPGNRLLFGIREMGATFRDFDYVVAIVTGSYEIVDDALILADDFELVYDYDPSGRADIPETIALSSIEFDQYADRLYLLTSFETPDADDEGLGAYLWTLPLADLQANQAPTLVLKGDGNPLLFAHKAEGIAVLGRDLVFVVHDDDRVLGRETVVNPETQFSRQRHQGAYTVVAIAPPVTEVKNDDSGFLTGGPASITLDAGVPEGSMVKAIINSGESLNGFVFEGIPDGIGLAPGRGSNTVDVFVAHEQTSVPFREEADFQDASVSRLTLSTEPGPMMGAVVQAEVAIAADQGYVRFCSAFMAGPDEGFSRYILFTGEESSDPVGIPPGTPYGSDASLSPQRQAGYAVVLDVDNGQSRPIVGLGRYNHENTIVVPGNWENQIALLSTDDTFNAPSSQLYLYLAESEGQVWEDQGNLWAFRVTGANGVPVDPADPFNGVNDYLDIQSGDNFQGEFIPVPDDIADGTTEGVPHDALEEWSNANNAFQFIRLEDLTYDTNDPRVVYLADTGATRIEADPATGRLKRGSVDTAAADNGRIFRFEFNQDDPTMVDGFSVFADGDGPDAAGFRNPDNLDTSSNSLMVQEDRSNARIWRYDFDAGSWSVAAAVNDTGGESSGIVDASKWFGDGTWLLDVQAHSTNESEQMKDGVLLKREDGQLLLMKIPGS